MPVIDKTTFDELKEMSGDEFINELIDTFLEDAPKMIAEIKSAYASMMLIHSVVRRIP